MYCKNLGQYIRRQTYQIKVGNLTIGSNEPIVVQTMTSTATNDIEGTVAQTIRSIEAGAQMVRITVPSMRDIEYLKEVKTLLRSRGYQTPLVADIHFNQKIAFEAAKIVEKVRINPGNFADSKKFKQLEYSNNEYSEELNRLKTEFLPLIDICKQYNTALRIGTNHGSLSDRIMSRYGDTPEGMAESALEFLRICKEVDFKNVVVSMKASNTLVMVEAMRLLVQKMDQEEMLYPLHLGVTEAGEGEDGRIKSAVGIGALLADGIGDTIRVSLTEEPEYEIPVAKKLIEVYKNHGNHSAIEPINNIPVNPYSFTRWATMKVLNLGDFQVPVVVAKFDTEIDTDLIPDYIPISESIDATEPDMNYLLEYGNTEKLAKEVPNIFPVAMWNHPDIAYFKEECFISMLAKEVSSESINILKKLKQKIIVLSTDNINGFADQRAAIFRLINAGIKLPVIIKREYNTSNIETLQLNAAADCGGLLLDGLCDGLWIVNKNSIPDFDICSTSFGILQASRMRVSKPDYISCPSCGRTQFNIQDTTRKIRQRTAHLKGLKIGIMGCIVNGLGEMADADYGYIGGAPGKVNLYHHKEIIKKGVSEDLAVDELINLIKDKGDWLEP
jgi:(E)-4-hydroxy-3-methylbut-2-enyl-diphosphate synthase